MLKFLDLDCVSLKIFDEILLRPCLPLGAICMLKSSKV